MVTRCGWCTGDALDEHYHDTEWGVPLHDDNRLFEALTLEGAQAGLSWRPVLHKRDNYRRLFADFDPAAVARFDDRKVAVLMGDAGIIRHEGKIRATIGNAQAVLNIQREAGSLDSYLWQMIGGETIANRWTGLDQLPSSTTLSAQMSRTLKKAGFRFVGPTTCYAFMQATGMVNDHVTDCFRHSAVASAQPGPRPGAGARQST